jgi:hypothetical protein
MGMIHRNTWIILAVFVVLLGFAYFTERNKQNITSNITPTPEVNFLPGVDGSGISGLKIQDNTSKEIVLDRDASGAWTLTTPKVDGTDTAQVEQAVTQLTSLSVVNTLDPAPAKDAVGLSPAVYTMTVTLKVGGQKIINVGKITPTQSGYYAQVDNGPMYVVSKYGLDEVLGLLETPPVMPTSTPVLTPGAMLQEMPVVTATLPSSTTVAPSSIPSTPTLQSEPTEVTIPITTSVAITSSVTVTPSLPSTPIGTTIPVSPTVKP